MRDFRVIIAGGRDFKYPRKLRDTLDAALIHKRETHNIIIVSGTARGADQWGEQYCHLRGYTLEEYPADWDGLGKAAGHIRNGEMGKAADAAVIFWNGKSRGTQGMISVMTRLRKPFKVVRY
jgi:hypothetical protein